MIGELEGGFLLVRLNFKHRFNIKQGRSELLQ